MRLVPLAPLAISASRVKETLSFRTSMSADTISVSLTAYPWRASDTAEPGAKSHHPWLFFLPASAERRRRQHTWQRWSGLSYLCATWNQVPCPAHGRVDLMQAPTASHDSMADVSRLWIVFTQQTMCSFRSISADRAYVMITFCNLARQGGT